MMKTLKIFAAVAIVLSMVACNSNKPAGKTSGTDSTGVAQSQDPKALLPSKAEVDSVSYLMGINLGSMIKSYNLGKLNYSQIKKGMEDFAKAKGNQNDTNFVKQFKVNPEDMNRIMQSFIEKRSAYTGAVNKKKEAEFLAANKTKAGVKVTPSGIQYIIKEAGNEVKPGPRDTVFVHYKLSTADGNVIQEIPATNPSVMLFNDRVVKGWAEGISLIGVGGKETLYIPSELGYGEQGNQGIEPNSTLVFDVQLDSVKAFVEKPAVEQPVMPNTPPVRK